jgi:alpha-beta hydrolase superfamily lysophospholipase
MATPVVFIHGLWIHASSWQRWIDLFTKHGYEGFAPGWPGESETVSETRSNPDAVADVGIDDALAHIVDFVGGLDEPPILIGHSVGALLAEKLLGENVGRAAVAIDPAQVKGVLPMPLRQLRAGLPVMANPLNITKSVSLSYDEFRFAFANAVSEDEAAVLYERWTIPAPAKPLFQTATVNFQLHSEAAVNTDKDSRSPLLLIAGGEDNSEPESITDVTLKRYRDRADVTELLLFRERGHALTIDHRWKAVAEEVLAWLELQGLSTE